MSNGENAAGDGGTITLNGVTYASGLGVSASSDIRFSLGGKCSSFVADVGVDDESGSAASILFQVYADGVQLFDSGLMSTTSPTQRVQVNVSAKNSLQLVVSDAGDGITSDHGDWADAKVICSSAPTSPAPSPSPSPTATAAYGPLPNNRVCSNMPAGTVTLVPGQSIQTAVDAYAAGTTFCLKTGTYYQQRVRPKSGNSFVGEPGVVLDGQGLTLMAFEGYARPANVTIDGMKITRYAPTDQIGAVMTSDMNGSGGGGWVIKNCEISYNENGTQSSWGIRPSQGTQILNNFIHHNGRIGIGGGGPSITGIPSGILIQDNEISYNDPTGFGYGDESGGIKFTLWDTYVVRHNHVHHNWGPGIWSDINARNAIFENNLVTDNAQEGIVTEISYGTIIRYNTVIHNGFSTIQGVGWLTGAGILVSATPNAQVYGNVVKDNLNGIAAIQQVRNDTPSLYGPHVLQNLDVHDNAITQSTSSGWANGVATDATSAGISGIAGIFGLNCAPVTTLSNSATCWNNRFYRNTYTLTGARSTPFAWQGERTYSSWQSLGLQ